MKFRNQLRLLIFPSLLIPVMVNFSYEFFFVTTNKIQELQVSLMEDRMHYILDKCQSEVAVLKALGMDRVGYFIEATKAQVLTDIRKISSSHGAIEILDVENKRSLYTSPRMKNLSVSDIPRLVSLARPEARNSASPAPMIVVAFEPWHWLLVATADKSEIDQFIRNSVIRTSLLVLVVLFVALGLVYRFSQRITRPIDELVLSSKKIAAREYDIGTRRRNSDEFDLLIEAFNDMASKIRENQELIVSKNQEVGRLNQELEQRVIERTSQLEFANKELEAFAYSVSHDLRAPLRHIDGYVELLISHCRSQLPDKGMYYLDTIADSTRQMGLLIDDLLEFSRQGRTGLHWDDHVDMNEMIQEVLNSIKESITGRTIEWIIGDLPSVRGDHAMLRQVWVNLLGNAVKYTRPKEVAKIEVRALKETGQITFIISDNGVGFDMRYVGKLFGVFQRLHSQEDFEGTGIGLATVQRIVSRHGGRIWADAEPNRGATFSFTLPQSKEETHA